MRLFCCGLSLFDGKTLRGVKVQSAVNRKFKIAPREKAENKEISTRGSKRLVDGYWH